MINLGSSNHQYQKLRADELFQKHLELFFSLRHFSHLFCNSIKTCSNTIH